MDNMREFSRVPFCVEAVLRVDGGEIPVEHSRDISMNGIFLEGPTGLKEGTDCSLVLELKGVEPPILVSLKGTIQRAVNGGCGVQFTQIPLESYEHLQRLVELNSQNPVKAEGEIKSHLGLNRR